MANLVNSPARLEAFSDGVIAVIITIMVLELKVPRQNGLAGLREILPTLAVYALSFAFTGIYWIYPTGPATTSETDSNQTASLSGPSRSS